MMSMFAESLLLAQKIKFKGEKKMKRDTAVVGCNCTASE